MARLRNPIVLRTGRLPPVIFPFWAGTASRESRNRTGASGRETMQHSFSVGFPRPATPSGTPKTRRRSGHVPPRPTETEVALRSPRVSFADRSPLLIRDVSPIHSIGSDSRTPLESIGLPKPETQKSRPANPTGRQKAPLIQHGMTAGESASERACGVFSGSAGFH